MKRTWRLLYVARGDEQSSKVRYASDCRIKVGLQGSRPLDMCRVDVGNDAHNEDEKKESASK